MLDKYAGRIDAIRRWFECYRIAWRAAISKAPADVATRAHGSLQCMAAPVQATVYLHVGGSSPIECCVVQIRRDPDRMDGEVGVVVVDESGAVGSDQASPAELFVEYLTSEWHNMKTNWTPGRELPPIPRRGRVDALRRGGKFMVGNEDVDEYVWVLPCDVADWDAEDLVRFDFQERAERQDEGEAAPTGLLDAPHIFAQGEERENTAVRRWLMHNADHVAQVLGIPPPWWCGVFVSRRHFMGASVEGDIDIVFGRTRFAIDEPAWQQRLAKVRSDWNLDTPQRTILEHTAMALADEGLIRWPEPLGQMAALEAKASWYKPAWAMTEDELRQHGSGGFWKATHIREGAQIRGQLSLLAKHFDRVSFMHLGATQPHPSPPINPWFQALNDGADAEESFPAVFVPDDIRPFGYYTSVFGAVGHATEEHSGSGGVLRVRRHASELQVGYLRAARDSLRQKLQSIAPPFLRTFVVECACGAWLLCSTPEAITSCKAAGCANRSKIDAHTPP